jgi:hypothetical protein
MLFREVMFNFLRDTETYILIQKTKKFFNIEHSGTYSKHWALILNMVAPTVNTEL